MDKAMTAEEHQLILMRGLIASLPAGEQAKVTECADKLRSAVADAGEYGLVAIALVGAEHAVKG